MHPFRVLYHGTNGDNILGIIDSGFIRPNDGKIYFARFNFEGGLMHGPDPKREASFCIKVLATLPSQALAVPDTTHGVRDTLVVNTPSPVSVQVEELYIRKARASSVETVKGTENIKRFLSAKK